MKSAARLDEKSTQQLIDNAVRTQAPIIIESPTWGPTTINGFLISGDNQALLMETTGRPATQLSTVVGSGCEAMVYSDDQRFVFSSTVTAAPQWGDSRSIAVARPQEIRVLERRRHPRAKLAPSSQVRLAWTSDGLARRYTAVLLNISPDGLACRIEGSAADAIDKGDLLMTRFGLPMASREFELEASVLNLTPTCEGRVILGLQFVRPQRRSGELDALRCALLVKPAPIPMEVFA